MLTILCVEWVVVVRKTRLRQIVANFDCLNRRLSSQLSREGVELSGFFVGLGLLGVRGLRIQIDMIDVTPIAGLF